MGHITFLQAISLIEEYAFRTCEAVVFLTFVWVYGKLAVRHLLKIARRD